MKGGQQWEIFCFRKLNNFELGHLIEMLIVPSKGTPPWKIVSWIHLCFPFMIFINFPYLAKHIMKQGNLNFPHSKINCHDHM
jgi:hypothetical protein